MNKLRALFEPRFAALTLTCVAAILFFVLVPVFPLDDWFLLPMALIASGLAALGLHDIRQTRHAILRNYPILAHLRFFLEDIRPEIRQYFFEGDKDGAPFPRDKRAIVYQRAKKDLDKRPFGTQFDVYQEQYEWLHQSLAPKPDVPVDLMRVAVGGLSSTFRLK